jgi:MFS family permease
MISEKPLDRRDFAFWNNIGVGIEYYDYVALLLLIPYISSAFFLYEGPNTGLIKTYLIAAAGPWSRLFFAFIFSWLLRLYDIGLLLIYGMIVMAVATFCIGLVPAFSSIGVASIILLIAFRVMQGIAFSLEMPHSLIFGSCYLPKLFDTFSSSTISNSAFGGFLAHFVMWLLDVCFSKQQMISWGWRIPFLLGGVLGCVGIVMRRRYDQYSLGTQAVQKPKLNLIEILKLDLWSLSKVVLLWIVSLTMVVNYTVLPYLFAKIYSLESKSVYPATMFGLIVAGFYSLLCGKFTRIFCFTGRVHYHLVCYGSLIAVTSMLLGKSILSIYIFCTLYQIVTTGLLNIGATLSLKKLKCESRVFVVGYNAANALASFTPIFVVSGGINVYIALGCLIFLSALYMILLDRSAA